MKPYLLLTPGPLTTSETVKEAMMTDWCTWDEDYNLGIVQELRKDLVNIATKKPEEYTSILLQVNPEKPDVPLNKNDAFQKVQKRHVQEKR